MLRESSDAGVRSRLASAQPKCRDARSQARAGGLHERAAARRGNELGESDAGDEADARREEEMVVHSELAEEATHTLLHRREGELRAACAGLWLRRCYRRQRAAR